MASDPAPTGPVRLVTVGDGWARRYLQVGSRLAASLGDALHDPEGELLELHHVGSTAVPGMPAKPTLDVMGRLARWPLAGAARARLLREGWRDHGEHGLPGRHYLTRGGHDVHLHLVAPEAPHLARHLVLRDLLRNDADARQRYGRVKKALVERHRGDRSAYVAGKDATVRDLEAKAMASAPARVGFRPLAQVVATLPCIACGPDRCAWAIGGGWALDLAAGEGPARLHEDVDLVLDRELAPATLAAGEAEGIRWRLHGAGGLRPWRSGQGLPGTAYRLEGRLGPLLAESDATPTSGEVGGSARPIFVDAVLEPRSPGTWRLRTDRSVQRPLDLAIARVRLPVGGGEELPDVPVLAPEVVLLSKACLSGRALPAPKDAEDAARHLPHMGEVSRRWLRAAVAKGAGEAWLALLEREGPPTGRRDP